MSLIIFGRKKTQKSILNSNLETRLFSYPIDSMELQKPKKSLQGIQNNWNKNKSKGLNYTLNYTLY